jgi:mannose-6-phosphate isomerase-like protein (cupin superfamily)
MSATPSQPVYTVAAIDVLAQTSDVQARIFTLARGEEIPWHFHSEVADWYVCLSGCVQVDTRAPRSSTTLTPGAMIKVEARTAHRVMNSGPITCRFLLLQGVGRFDYLPVGGPPAS